MSNNLIPESNVIIIHKGKEIQEDMDEDYYRNLGPKQCHVLRMKT
jgi:hypothetical protein